MGAWDKIKEFFGQSEPEIPVYSKADIDRPLYSQQNRERVAKSVGYEGDPLADDYPKYAEKMYKDTSPTGYQPRPLMGAMEMEALKRPQGDSRADFQDLAAQYDERHPGEIPEKSMLHHGSQMTGGGEYEPGRDSITMYSWKGLKPEEFISSLQHETEHRKDLKDYKLPGLAADLFPSYQSPDPNRRTHVKFGHHRDYEDMETDKPLYDMLKAALSSGERVNPSHFERFDQLKSKYKSQLEDPRKAQERYLKR